MAEGECGMVSRVMEKLLRGGDLMCIKGRYISIRELFVVLWPIMGLDDVCSRRFLRVPHKFRNIFVLNDAVTQESDLVPAKSLYG
jgi:hypothetical protein